ncbi:hypothetical protein CEXT_252751 [Caerostris extrusa]|uniref:Uncharacterized protein n=1 Tax=Caerostris extrusa TaxID=172846 RepID=A0AAV4N0J8_CAEEX|nr:hypothetical protein CEXT_252751 [Caerostris extrusa]
MDIAAVQPSRGAGKKPVNGNVIALEQHQSEKPSLARCPRAVGPGCAISSLPVRITFAVMTVARNYFTSVMDTCSVPRS